MNTDWILNLLNWLPDMQIGGFDMRWPALGLGGVVSLVLGIWALVKIKNELVAFFAPPAATKKQADQHSEQNRDLAKSIAELKALVEQQAQVPGAAPADANVSAGRGEAVERIVTRGEVAEIAALNEFASGEVGEALDDLFAHVDDIQDEADRLKAQKLRDIGILALDREPGRAIEAYRRATDLDGSDFWAWVYLSRLEKNWQGDLNAAKIAAERAMAVAGSDRERSVSLDELGNMAVSSGDGAGALAFYSESLGIFRALAACDIDNAGAQRDVSISLNKLGDVAELSGDSAGALTYYTEGLGIFRALAAGDKGNVEAQRDVSVSLEKLGDIAMSSGDRAGALAYFTEGLEIRRALAVLDTGNAGAQRDLSFSLDRLGDVAELSGNNAGALAYFIEGLEIRRALVDTDRGNAEAQRDVSISLDSLGDVAGLSGDSAGALAYFTEGLEIRRALADTGNAIAQRDLSVSLNRLGGVAELSGDSAGALAYYTKCLEIHRALAALDTGNARAQRDLIASLDKLGSVSGDKAYWREALEIAEAMATAGILSAVDVGIPDYLRATLEGE